MNASRWIRLVRADEIPVREGRLVRVGRLSIAVFNAGDRFLAVDNRCPHQGGPLADGILGGHTVACPLHNWRVDLETGAVVKPCDSGAEAVRTYAVKVEDGVVMMCLPAAQAAA